MIITQNVFIRNRRGKYYVVLDYRDPETNKRKQKVLESCEKPREANKLLIEYKSKINNDTFIDPKKLKLSEYISSWIIQHKSSLSITTYNRYNDIIKRHIVKYLGDIQLQKLSPMHIENFYNTMLKDIKLSPKTIIQYHRILHKALDKAYKMQLISKNPADLVELPKVKKYTAHVLNVMESKQLLEACKNTRLEIPINLALILGLRAGEILGLSWDNINFENKTIDIVQSLVKDSETKLYHLQQPKSDTSIRTLTAPETLMNLLKIAKLKQDELGNDYNNEYKLVFTKINGEPMTSDSFSRMFRDFLKQKKLPLIRFHDLRHTNATIMLVSGTSMKVASSRLGHSSISITADLYTHVLQGLETDASDKIANVIYGQQWSTSGQQNK